MNQYFYRKTEVYKSWRRMIDIRIAASFACAKYEKALMSLPKLFLVNNTLP